MSNKHGEGVAAGAPVVGRPPEQTSWFHVLIATAAGFVTAFQLGKVPAAIPMLKGELGLSLFVAGAVVSILAMLTAFGGLLIGMQARRFGDYRSAIAALALSAVASAAGAFAEDGTLLLVTRTIEGIGYVLAVVSLPGLIVAHVSARDRPLAMAIWGTFLPGGMALMLLLAAFSVDAIGWRGLWVLTSVSNFGAAILIFILFRSDVATRPAIISLAREDILRPDLLLLFGCFICLAGQYLAVVSFFPTLLSELFSMDMKLAATLSVAVVAGNGVGNVLSGMAMRAGVGTRTLLVAPFAAMAVLSLVVFADVFPLAARIVAAVAFSVFSGSIPAVVWAAAPKLSRSPDRMPVTSGLMFQGAGIGQFVGPMILATLVTGGGGWSYSIYLTVPASLIGMLLASLVKVRIGE